MAMLCALTIAMPAGARGGRNDIPPEVQGTYSYRDRASGSTVTVGYICPGDYLTFGGYDIYANYWGRVESREKWKSSITRHAPWKLDGSMQEYFGLRLSAEALQVLRDDAATIPCDEV